MDSPKVQIGQFCHSDDALMFRSVLERLGDKWSLMVIASLDDQPQRFTELLERVSGISRRMLAHTLRNLERDGLVRREAYAEVPPRVEYTATELGRTLVDPVMGLATWVWENQSTLSANREAFDDRRGARPDA